MPLTEKGKEILAAMKEQYGEEKGEQVFYASRNKGTISGVDMATKDVADPRIESINDEEETDDAFVVYNKNKHKKIGDADDPNMMGGENEEDMDKTEDAPGVYSKGRRARRGSPLTDSKGVGKKPSFLTSDSKPTLQQMNRNNRDFWGNGPRYRGRGR